MKFSGSCLPWIYPARAMAVCALLLFGQQAMAGAFIDVSCEWDTTVSGQVIEPERDPCSSTATLSDSIYYLSVSALDTYSWNQMESFVQESTDHYMECHAVESSLLENGQEFNRQCDIIPYQSDQPDPILTMDCTLRDNYETEDSAGTCRITNNRDIASELPEDEQPSDNQLSIIDSFLLACFTGSDDAFCQELENATSEQLPGLLQALMPLNPETAVDMTQANQRGGGSAVQQRQTRLRTGNPVAGNNNVQQTRRYFANNQWLEPGTRLAATGNSASDAAAEYNGMVEDSISTFGRLGVFVNASVADGRYNRGSLSGRNKFSAGTVTFGTDYRFSESLVGGIAANIGQSSVKYRNEVYGELDADTYELIGYGSWYSGNWYLDGALTLGSSRYNQLRDPTAVANSYEASYNGTQYNLATTLGHDFVIDGFSISPFARLTLGRLDTDAYSEKKTDPGGAGPAPMEIDKQKRDIGTVAAGSHFRYVITSQHGVFIPVLSLTAIHDFENGAQQITGRFVGTVGSDNGFSVNTMERDSSFYIIAAGMSFQLKNGNAGFINLESVESYSYLDQYRLTMGWRWEL